MTGLPGAVISTLPGHLSKVAVSLTDQMVNTIERTPLIFKGLTPKSVITWSELPTLGKLCVKMVG